MLGFAVLGVEIVVIVVMRRLGWRARRGTG
jgi:hypothetical protein